MQTLAVKTYPGCHYFQTAFTAIERLRALSPGLSADVVVAVGIDTTQLACEATRFAAGHVAEGGLTAVAFNFDLSLSAALLLHAGRLSPQDLDAEYLGANERPLRALASRVTVRHDPVLTARVIASACRAAMGRAALGSVGLPEALRLARCYRAEYRSTLISAGGRRSPGARGGPPAPPTGSACRTRGERAPYTRTRDHESGAPED